MTNDWGNAVLGLVQSITETLPIYKPFNQLTIEPAMQPVVLNNGSSSYPVFKVPATL